MKKEQLETLLTTKNSAGHYPRHDDLTAQALRVRFHILGQAISNLETQHCERNVHNAESYFYIPIPPVLFVDILIDAWLVLGKQRSKRFLDVGCGVGTTVLLAQTMFDAYGFDYNPELIAKASFLVGERAFHADAREYNQYGEFDFIYYYRPFYDDWMFLDFERKIHASLKPGAVVCPVWELFDWANAPGMEQVGDFLYQRIPSNE